MAVGLKRRGKVRTFGHQAGAETLKAIVKIADKIGVKVISAYAFQRKLETACY